MTIKTIAISALAASLLSTSAFAAGVLTTTAKTIATELVTDKNNTISLDLNLTYTPSITGTLNQGSVIYNFTNAAFNDTNVTDFRVYNVSQSRYVTNNAQVGSAGQLICDINDTITSGDSLFLSKDDTTLAATAADLNATVLAGFSSSDVSIQLTNSATTVIDTSNTVTGLSATQEWAVAVNDKFNAQIDAAVNFVNFVSDVSTTDDNATIKFTKATVNYSAGAITPTTTVVATNEINATGALKFFGTTATMGTDNNFTATTAAIAATDLAGVKIDYLVTTSNATAMSETDFSVKVVGAFANNAAYLPTVVSSSAQNMGSWTVYGYNANIPAASYSAGVTDTVINIVNNQTAATADMVMVITDATANTCTLTSTSDTEVAKPAANSTTKYKLSEMLANTKCSALTGTLYSIQATLPTTPSNVFGQAAVVRTDSASGISKVLPVYNNGTKY